MVRSAWSRRRPTGLRARWTCGCVVHAFVIQRLSVLGAGHVCGAPLPRWAPWLPGGYLLATVLGTVLAGGRWLFAVRHDLLSGPLLGFRFLTMPANSMGPRHVSLRGGLLGSEGRSSTFLRKEVVRSRGRRLAGKRARSQIRTRSYSRAKKRKGNQMRWSSSPQPRPGRADGVERPRRTPTRHYPTAWCARVKAVRAYVERAFLCRRRYLDATWSTA